jgi:hypothetical protein
MGLLDRGTRLARGTSAEVLLYPCRPGWSGLVNISAHILLLY